MEENEQEDLVDWIDNQFKEFAKSLGFELQMIDYPQKKPQGTTLVSGTITFLKGDSVKKAREFYQKNKE